jgi:hypothetical protein
MNIYYFLATLAGASTVIIWLGKFIITKAVDVGIEKYKAELIKDIEKHKAELSRVTIEHQVKFSKLHEQRAEKIKTLYGHVRELEKSLNYSTTRFQGSSFGTDTERDDKCRKLAFELEDVIDIERIYFSDLTIQKFESIISESKEILSDIAQVRHAYSEYDRLRETSFQISLETKHEMEKWKEVEKRVEQEFKELKLELANEFRGLLGIKI